MSTPHQAIAEWHARAEAAERRAIRYDPESPGGSPFASAAELAALNATLCGLGALLS